VSNAQETAKRAAALLDRSDELRAEARDLLDPLHKSRGWRGSTDYLSALMNFELPKKSDLLKLRALRKEKLTHAAKELDDKGISIGPVPGPRRLRGR
jgi:hypothetical protein